MMKDRKAVIKTLQSVANALAERYGFSTMEVGEDRDKGIWGEKFTEYLEERHGECTEKIHWYKDEESKRDAYVEFRFRFASPLISVHIKGEQNVEIMGNVEFSNYNYETKEYDTDFRISECMAWGW